MTRWRASVLALLLPSFASVANGLLQVPRRNTTADMRNNCKGAEPSTSAAASFSLTIGSPFIQPMSMAVACLSEAFGRAGISNARPTNRPAGFC